MHSSESLEELPEILPSFVNPKEGVAALGKIPLHIWFPDPDNPDAPRRPLPIQEEAWYELLGRHHHDLDVLFMLGGTGCLAKGTPVLMYSGARKKVEDVNVGDLLMGPDSKPRRVTRQIRGRETMYRVIPHKGKPWVCNESHVLSLRGSGVRIKKVNGKEVLRTGDVINITVRDFLQKSAREQRCWKLYKPRIPLQFPSSDKKLPLDPYFLGLWLGDGSKHGPTITNPEPEIEEFLQRCAEDAGSLLKNRQSNPQKCANWAITNGNLGGKENFYLTQLRELGLLKNKYIPSMYLKSSIENRLQLLAGLLDADGHLCNGSYYEISQKRKHLSAQICFLARSLGFAVFPKRTRKACTYRGKKIWGTYYRLSICGDVERLPLRVPRKKLAKHFEHKANDPLVSGFKLEKLPEDDFYGFQLDGPDRLFLLGDFTVTHNSGKTKAAVGRCLWAAKTFKGAVILVGSTDFGHLERTVIKDYEKLLTIDDPEVIKKYGLRKGAWNHPFVKAGGSPKKHHKTLDFINGSVIHFMGIDDPGRVLSMEIDIFHFEEPQRLLNLDQFFDVAFTRLRNKAIPWKQLIMTANPNDDLGILWDKFDLDQLSPDFVGERRPIGRPCECHLCQKCKKFKKTDVPFVQGVCLSCGNKKKMKCPGNQYFFRVIPCDSSDNHFVGETYDMNMRLTMDKRKYDQLGKGLVRRHTKGKLYGTYNPQKHVLKGDSQIDLDPTRDVIWCLDHNNHPQSSVVLQEFPRARQGSGPALVTVIEEMVLWGYTAEEVGEAFVKRFRALKLQGSVLMYGDPSMFTGKIEGKVDHKFAIIQSVLEDCGFRVVLLARPTKYFIKDRIDAVNRLLEDGNGTVRLKVNERCEHVTLGLSFLEWHKNGKKQDASVDDKARDSGNFDRAHVMTHPMDALGYFIVEKYPIMEAWQEHPYILSTASSTRIELDTKEGDLREEKIDADEDDLATSADEREEEDDIFEEASDEFEEEMKFERKHETRGLAQILRAQDLWRAKPSQN